MGLWAIFAQLRDLSKYFYCLLVAAVSTMKFGKQRKVWWPAARPVGWTPHVPRLSLNWHPFHFRLVRHVPPPALIPFPVSLQLFLLKETRKKTYYPQSSQSEEQKQNVIFSLFQFMTKQHAPSVQNHLWGGQLWVSY